jgi:hypothetical protein
VREEQRRGVVTTPLVRRDAHAGRVHHSLSIRSDGAGKTPGLVLFGVLVPVVWANVPRVRAGHRGHPRQAPLVRHDSAPIAVVVPDTLARTLEERHGVDR